MIVLLLLSLIAIVFGQQRNGPFYFIDAVTPLGKIPVYRGNEKFLIDFEKIREDNTWLKVPGFALGEFGWGTAFYSTFRDYNCVYQGFEQTVTFEGIDTPVNFNGSFRLMEEDYQFGSVKGVAGDVVWEFNMENWPFQVSTDTLWTRINIVISDVSNSSAFCTFKSGTHEMDFYNIEDGESVPVTGYIDNWFAPAMQIDFRFPPFTTLKHMSIFRMKTTCDVTIDTWNFTASEEYYNRTGGTGITNGGSSSTGSGSSTGTGTGSVNGTDSGSSNGTDSSSGSGSSGPINSNQNDQSSNNAFALNISFLSLALIVLFMLL